MSKWGMAVSLRLVFVVVEAHPPRRLSLDGVFESRVTKRSSPRTVYINVFRDIVGTIRAPVPYGFEPQRSTTMAAIMSANAGPFTLSPLPYDADALEPVISAKTVGFHYHKHHQAY